MARILVIDDEKGIRNTLKDILEYEKHEVEVAGTGEEGLDLLNNNSFDLVFLDVKMPGLDGIEVLESISINHPEVAVIMATALGKARPADNIGGDRGRGGVREGEADAVDHD